MMECYCESSVHRISLDEMIEWIGASVATGEVHVGIWMMKVKHH